MTPPGAARLSGLAAAFLAAALAVVASLLGAVPASGTTPTYAYSTAAYVYDAPALLSSQGVAASYVRGSPSGPEAVSPTRSVSVRADVVAANTGLTAIEASPRVAPWAGNSLSRLFTEGETMYRVWGGSDQVGSWVTPIGPVSSAAARECLALPPENAATYVSRVTLAPGVHMQVGTAGPAFGQPGGWAQAQLLEHLPLSSFGKGELLP